MNVRAGITGIGLISSIGIGYDNFAQGVLLGKCGKSKLDEAEFAEFPNVPVGKAEYFDPAKHLGKIGLKYFDRSAILSMITTKFAMESAAAPFTDEEISNAGVILGTALGGVHSIAVFDRSALLKPKYVNPMIFPNTVINAPASQVSIKYGMKNINVTICTGQASGIDALGYALNEIKRRGLRVAFAGGMEELCQETQAAFGKNNLFKRAGDFLSEGAAMFLLEDKERAELNGRPPLAEIAGYASRCDAGFNYQYNPEAYGASECMRLALEDADASPWEVDLIYSGCYENTAAWDMQSKALSKVFGERTPEIKNIKPLVGECMGAFGALEAAAAVYDLRENGKNLIMVNIFGCNGVNSSLILRRNPDN